MTAYEACHEKTCLLGLRQKSNVQIVFSGYFDGANLFPPVFGPNKHTGEVRFCVKTMCKKLKSLFFEFYIFFQSNRKSWRKIIHYEPVHVG